MTKYLHVQITAKFKQTIISVRREENGNERRKRQRDEELAVKTSQFL